MPASIKPANVDSFISYSRVDADFARLFYVRLQESGFRLWRDRSEMEGGQNWFQQILSAIEQVDTLILCLSPAAIRSPNVADEWRHARRVGTRVIPVIAADVDFNSVPRWMKKVDWLDFRKSRLFNPTLPTTDAEQDLGWERFIHQLKTPDQPLKVPYTNPLLKKTFVQRPKLYDALKVMLLQETQPETVAITTTALSGGGGFGKTTLATALCCDEDIQSRYDDGILWIEFGETPDMLTLLTNQICLLSSEPLTVTSINAVAARFCELIEKRDMLLVLDDVWGEEPARPFLEGASTCTRLITTRRLDVTAQLKVKTPVVVNDMETAEAAQFLLKLTDSSADSLPLVSELAVLLGEYPLMLELAGAYLRDVMLNDALSLTEAIDSLRARLTAYGYTAFDREDSNTRNASLQVSLSVSLERLGKWKDRYLELAIFPEDTNIPLATLAQLWGATSGLKGLAVENAYKAMHRLSLFTEYVPNKTVRLHDVIRHYLEQRQGEKKLGELHGTLLNSYTYEHWADLADNEPYLWDQLAYHLHAAARNMELVTTVKNGLYLVRKTHLRGTASVEHDLAAAQTYRSTDSSLALLARTYMNMTRLLNHAQTEPEISQILYQRTQHLPKLHDCWEPLPPTWHKPHIDLNLAVPQPLSDLPHPALIRTLDGHTRRVSSGVYSPDGRHILSASVDQTLKVWDAASGSLLRTLDGHTNWVDSAVYSPDGCHILSASWDHTLKVWDAASGSLLRTLEGHTRWVYSAVYSPDGRHILSASHDQTLKVWDAANGNLLRTLEGHTDRVNSGVYSPDGQHILSASNDRTLKVWDAANGSLLRTLDGHTLGVNSGTYSPDGRHILSASHDQTLKVWDAANGSLLHTLDGHTDWVHSGVYSPDGRHILSASGDHTLKVWDAANGSLLRTLDGHTNWVHSGVYSPDGRHILSASNDKALKVWNAANGSLLRTLDGHTNWVYSGVYSPDGRHILSASWDHTLKVWNADSGSLLRTLDGHTDSVYSGVYSPDGRHILSASWDHTLKVWDAASGSLLRTLDGHTDSVYSGVYSPDGQHILSASRDTTLKVWDAASGSLLRTLDGHTSWVDSGVYSPDGQHILSASRDTTLKVWDADNGSLLRTLDGHTAGVTSGVYSPDSRHILSTSDDETLKVWDADSGDCLATFYADGSLDNCAWHPGGEYLIAVGRRGIYWLRWVE